mgnify:CR=1 FL=1
MINKDNMLPISAVATAIALIGGSIWTSSEVFKRFTDLEKKVANTEVYDDTWIRELADSNMNRIIRLETIDETYEEYDDEDIRHVIEGQDFRLQEVERTINRLDGIVERL